MRLRCRAVCDCAADKHHGAACRLCASDTRSQCIPHATHPCTRSSLDAGRRWYSALDTLDAAIGERELDAALTALAEAQSLVRTLSEAPAGEDATRTGSAARCRGCRGLPCAVELLHGFLISHDLSCHAACEHTLVRWLMVGMVFDALCTQAAAAAITRGQAVDAAAPRAGSYDEGV